MGDTTITSNRSQYVDFTIPYTDLGVGMLVPNEKDNMWIFLKPLSTGLWITSAGFFILTGFIVWLIERPVNKEFQGTRWQQIGTIFWFSFSTLVFAHSKYSISLLPITIMQIFLLKQCSSTQYFLRSLSSLLQGRGC